MSRKYTKGKDKDHNFQSNLILEALPGGDLTVIRSHQDHLRCHSPQSQSQAEGL